MNNLKIAIFQFNPIVGDLVGNTNQLISAANEARNNGCDLFQTSELAVSGYPPEDLLLRPDFYKQALLQLERFKQIRGITLLIGCPYTDQSQNYNSVFVIHDGVILGRHDKNILPNYGVFDERRYFTPGTDTLLIQCKGTRIGIIICEDMWQSAPAHAARLAGAEILCILNASPYNLNKHKERIELAVTRVIEIGAPIIYVNQFGGQDELIFDGASFAMNADTTLCAQLPAFSQQLAYLDYTEGKFVRQELSTYPADIESMYQALVLGVRDYINKNSFKGVLLGLSGGVDSALTLAISVDALGADKVMAVMMPSLYTQDISITDSREMAKRLGVRYEEIAINPIFNQFQTQLQGVFAGLAEDTTEENLQARIRGTLLMAISNKLGYLVLTTGNKSEMTTGYATLYGDMAGGYAVLKDILKTQVYELCKWRNQVSDIIPERIISRAPSAELRHNQTDQDSLPDYAVLDQIIHLLVHELLSVDDVIHKGFPVADVNKVAILLKHNEYKRRQAAVGPKINSRAFSKDWRYPITNRFKF